MIAGPVAMAKAEMRRDRLTLITQSAQHTFEIEIADTPGQKARGLMFRTALPETHGMLFPYGDPQEITMWMRNTYIPLDMVFLTAEGIVHRIEARTQPMSDRVIASQGPVTAVLELAGGVAERIGLKPGDRAVHEIFKPR